VSFFNLFSFECCANLGIRYPWSNGKARNTMTFDRSFITSEDDGKLNWDVNNAVMYSVVNKDAPNKYGEYRGWKIMPGKYRSLVVRFSKLT